MKIQRILAAASVMTLAGVATAQQTPAGAVERITFQQAIEIALRQNLTVRQAENTLENANLAARQAGQPLWPNLNFSLNGSNSFGRAFDPSTGNIYSEQTRSASSGVSSSFTLFDAGRTRNNIRSARSDAAATESDLFRQRQTTVYNVAQGFVAYIDAQSQLDVQKENLTSLQLQEAQIQRFADAGARPISDLYQIKSQVATAQLAVVRAEAAIENAKFGLMRTLLLDPAKDYEFVPPPIPESATTINYNLDSLVSLAYARRRDVVAAQSRVEAAEYDRRVARMGHMPSLGLSASYGSNGVFGRETAPGGLPNSFMDQFDRNRGGSIGLGISVPVLDRGNTSLSKQRAAIQAENAQLQLATARQTVALDVRTAWYNVRSAQQQLVAAQAGLTAASQALEATQQRYNVGAATLLDVTQARAQRVNAASALATARYALLLNQAAMSYFTGELDPLAMNIGGAR
ncbi:MAG TPA: TolC family protein [Gemmatimonadaceae bacterium]|nr:TolC family protein [Gemmatimonadaceae bacterium]